MIKYLYLLKEKGYQQLCLILVDVFCTTRVLNPNNTVKNLKKCKDNIRYYHILLLNLILLLVKFLNLQFCLSNRSISNFKRRKIYTKKIKQAFCFIFYFKESKAKDSFINTVLKVCFFYYKNCIFSLTLNFNSLYLWDTFITF